MDMQTDTLGAQEPPPPGRTRWTLYAVWALVILLTAGTFWLQASRRAAAQEDAAADSAHRYTPMLRIMGRLGLGFHAIFSHTQSGGNPQMTETFSKDVKMWAISPLDRVRAAAILAELQGAPAAVSWLDGVIEEGRLDESLLADAQALRGLYEETPVEPTPDEAAGLVERHGWFGRLALSFGKPAGDPARQAVIAPAVRAAVAVIALELVGLLAVLVGLGLLVWAIVWVAMGKVASGYRQTAGIEPAPGGGQVFLETLAVLLIAMPLLSLVSEWIGAPFTVRYMLVWLLAPVVLWPRLRGVSWSQWRAGMGWHTGRGVLREVGSGLFAYLTALPALALVIVLVFVLIKHADVQSQPQHPIIYMADGAGFWRTVCLYVLACVWAPLVEESVFRGALYHHLRQGVGVVIAALVSGFIFAIIHPQGLVGVPAIMALGATFALIREWRGSVIASATAHACNNFIVVTLLLVMMA